jgi:hypothetical protein
MLSQPEERLRGASCPLDGVRQPTNVSHGHSDSGYAGEIPDPLPGPNSGEERRQDRYSLGACGDIEFEPVNLGDARQEVGQ